MNDENHPGRAKFNELFDEYGLGENDIAWSIFKSGWDERATFEYELDLHLAELESENKKLMEQLKELRKPHVH